MDFDYGFDLILHQEFSLKALSRGFWLYMTNKKHNYYYSKLLALNDLVYQYVVLTLVHAVPFYSHSSGRIYLSHSVIAYYLCYCAINFDSLIRNEPT